MLGEPSWALVAPIAAAMIIGHALRVTRQSPALALRDE
jgi:hypothetical protein